MAALKRILSVKSEAVNGRVAALKQKILIVDDSISIRKSVSFILSQAGYTVVEAEDGLIGLNKAKTEIEKFGLVITDINMPNMDGIQLIKELRKTDGYKFTAIIALTGCGNKEIKNEMNINSAFENKEANGTYFKSGSVKSQ